MSARRRYPSHVQEAIRASVAAPGATVRAGVPLQGTMGDADAPEPSTALRTWELWFAARLGPARWRVRRGVRVKDRRLELPPAQNDRLHHHAKAAWVKEWRTEAWVIARRRQLPRIEHARISAIVYRARLGTADAFNDFERCKPIIDGLVAAGALAGDTYKHVTPGTIEERRGEPGILLIVEEV
jgi:hypothetical protein